MRGHSGSFGLADVSHRNDQRGGGAAGQQEYRDAQPSSEEQFNSFPIEVAAQSSNENAAGNNGRNIPPHEPLIPGARARIATRPEVYTITDGPDAATMHVEEGTASRGAANRLQDSWYGGNASFNADAPVVHADASSTASSNPSAAVSKCTRGQKCAICSSICFFFVFAAVGGGLFIHLKYFKDWKPAAPPVGPCSDSEVKSGCAPGFCGTGNCQCPPNLDKAGSRCVTPLKNKPMQFYSYHLQGDGNVDVGAAPEGNWLGSLEGIMWILHHRIVTSCPRNQMITRIVRLKTTVYNTGIPFSKWQGQFGPWANLSWQGKCVAQNCNNVYRTYGQYGFVAGCLQFDDSMGDTYGNATQWYSLPAASGDFKIDEKRRRLGAPGGQCSNPSGSAGCTWNVEAAGEVRLDDLANIKDYKSFCASGNIEYDERTDQGRGCDFWNHRASSDANAARVARLQQLFVEKNIDAPSLPEPICDNEYAQCKYHSSCQQLEKNCCPDKTGQMLDCCYSNNVSTTV
jgi:hypothetical protein